MIPSRTRRGAAIAMLAIGVVAFTPACSSDSDGSGVLDQVAPTKADIASEAGISFPPSTSGFRLVRVSGSQLDVTFTLPVADVDAFASGSGLELRDGERAITHASPLWDLAVTGEFQGAESTKDQVKRTVEVVPDGDVATVRLTVQQV